MRAKLTPFRPGLLALVTLFCAGYVGCSKGPEQPAAVATPTPAATTPAPATPEATEVPGTGTPTSVSAGASGSGSAAPASGSGSSRTAPGSAALAAPRDASVSASAPAEIPAPPPPPRVFTLSSSTPISIYTTTELSTKTSRAGDSFTGTLARPIVDRDWVVARDGAPVEGVVLNSDPGGRVKGVASITVALRRLTLADGRKIDVSTSAFTQQAKTTKAKDAEKIIGGAGVGAVIGALAGGRKGAAIGAGAGGAAGTGYVLATRGDPAVIARESHLSFRVKAPVRITKQQRIP